MLKIEQKQKQKQDQDTFNLSQNQAQHQQESDFIEELQQPRIYSVTDGVKSPYTKQAYRLTFNHFINTIIKNPDLRILINYKPSVIESKIIDYIEYLKAQNLALSTIQVYLLFVDFCLIPPKRLFQLAP